MPIYEYRCSDCGHQQDHLQKVSDPVLTTCPACGMAAYAKQVTAAGFQLKGSGWYATDFKGGAKPPAAKGESDAKADGKAESKPEAKVDAKTESKPDAKTESKPDAKTESGAKAAAPADGS